MMKSLLFLLLTATSLSAAPDGLLLDLIVPPGEKDRFQHAEYSCWIADASKPVKAVIIHQHGCTNASPDKQTPITSELGLKMTDFLATSRDSAPEPLRHEGLIDDSTLPHTSTLTFLDAAGNVSPHSQP